MCIRDRGGVPAEILGDTGAHTGDHPVLGITVQLLIHINLLLVGHLYDGVAQDLAVEFKTRLEHLSHYVFSKALVLNVHDGVHQLRVKFLALGLDLLDALLGKQLLELVEDCLLYTSRSARCLARFRSEFSKFPGSQPHRDQSWYEAPASH